MCDACSNAARNWLEEYGPIEGADIPRLRKAVEWAEAEAHRRWPRWNQAFWFKLRNFKDSMIGQKVEFADCGTTACIAGWVCATEGDMFLVDREGSAEHCVWIDDQGREHTSHIESRATKLLGLQRSDTAASALFNGTNTISDVREIAEMIAGERL